MIETDVVMQYVNSRTLEEAFNLVQVNSFREAEEVASRYYFNAIITDQAENNFYDDHAQKLANLLNHSLNKTPILICQALLLRQKDIDILVKFGYKSFFYKPLQTANITEGLKKGQPTHQ